MGAARNFPELRRNDVELMAKKVDGFNGSLDRLSIPEEIRHRDGGARDLQLDDLGHELPLPLLGFEYNGGLAHSIEEY